MTFVWEGTDTMAHFDRHDICAAWNLYLQHTHAGQGSRKYARLSALRSHFRPSRSEEHIEGLSENALEIYRDLARPAEPAHKVANSRSGDGESLFLMWAGCGSKTLHVYVWADSFESAFEALVEWLDDNAPGCLVSYDDARSALHQYMLENNINEIDERDGYAALCEAVEQDNDWTVIGHTTLKHGGHIRSYEWGGDEIDRGCMEWERVLLWGVES